MIGRPVKNWIRKQTRAYGRFRLPKRFCFALAGIVVCLCLLIGTTQVLDTSMLPTLRQEQRAFFLRQRLFLKRGDVVLVRLASGELFVSRIIALEGDVVELKHDVLYVNGEADPHCLTSKTMEQPGVVQYPYTVPEDMVFLVGDNRPASEDSRSFGAIPVSSVKGRLFVK